MVAGMQIRVHQSFVDVLEKTQERVAEEIKTKYGVREAIFPGTFISQVIVAKLSKDKAMSFKVNKTSKDRGILEISGRHVDGK